MPTGRRVDPRRDSRPAPNFSEENFVQLDTNGDGLLTLADLPSTLFRRTTISEPDTPGARSRRCNQDGVLDYAEIAAAFPTRRPNSWLPSMPIMTGPSAARNLWRSSVLTPPATVSFYRRCGLRRTDYRRRHPNHRQPGPWARHLGAPADIDGNGVVDAVDIQKVILSALR